MTEYQSKKPMSKITASYIDRNDKRLVEQQERDIIIKDLMEKRKDLFQQLNRLPIAN